MESVELPPKTRSRVGSLTRGLGRFFPSPFLAGLGRCGGSLLFGGLFRFGFPRQGFQGIEFIFNGFDFILNLVLDVFLIFFFLSLNDIRDSPQH